MTDKYCPYLEQILDLTNESPTPLPTDIKGIDLIEMNRKCGPNVAYKGSPYRTHDGTIASLNHYGNPLSPRHGNVNLADAAEHSGAVGGAVETRDPYFGGSPGAFTPPTSNIGGCTWDFETTITSVYSTRAAEALAHFTRVDTQGATCTTNANCTGSDKCGRTLNAAPPLISSTLGCGSFLGYFNGKNICDKVPTFSNTFTDCPTNLALFDGAGSCYQRKENCSGCMDWATLGIAVASGEYSSGTKYTTLCPVGYNTPAWINAVEPQVEWFKRTCPSAYSYPYDDPSSTFKWPRGADKIDASHAFGGINMVNHLVVFCPQNSNFTSPGNPALTPNFRIVKVYNNCDDPVWPGVTGGGPDSKHVKTTSISCSYDDDCTAHQGLICAEYCFWPANYCNTSADCYGGSSCASNNLCFWDIPDVHGGNSYELQKGESLSFYFPIPTQNLHPGVDIFSGSIIGRKGCTSGDPSALCADTDCRTVGATTFKCAANQGATPPLTLFEVTFITHDVDYYDVSLVEGFNIPMEANAIVA